MGGVFPTILMLLLTQLTRLHVQLSEKAGRLQVDVPSGALTDEVRQAMAEHKAALLRYTTDPSVQTPDGSGVLTGAHQETDPLCYGTRHGERLRYKIGVRLLQDEVERFYLPGTVWEG